MKLVKPDLLSQWEAVSNLAATHNYKLMVATLGFLFVYLGVRIPHHCCAIWTIGFLLVGILSCSDLIKRIVSNISISDNHKKEDCPDEANSIIMGSKPTADNIGMFLKTDDGNNTDRDSFQDVNGLKDRNGPRNALLDSRLQDLVIDQTKSRYLHLLGSENPILLEFEEEKITYSALNPNLEVTFGASNRQRHENKLQFSVSKSHGSGNIESQVKGSIFIKRSDVDLRKAYESIRAETEIIAQEILKDVEIRTGLMNLTEIATNFKLDVTKVRQLNEGRLKVVLPEDNNKTKENTEPEVKPSTTISTGPTQTQNNPIASAPQNTNPGVNVRKYTQHQGGLSTINESKFESSEMGAATKNADKEPIKSTIDNKTVPKPAIFSSMFGGQAAAPEQSSSLFGSQPTQAPSKPLVQTQPNPQSVTFVPGPGQPSAPSIQTPKPQTPSIAPPSPAQPATMNPPTTMKIPADALVNSRTIFTNLTAEAETSGKSLPADKKTSIEEQVTMFFNQICNKIDEHFLNCCRNLISFLDDRVQNKQEYILFVKTFFTKLYLSPREQFSNNKQKFMYIGVALQIISVYHPLVAEVIFAVTHRKFPFLAGVLTDVQEDREKYLKEIGFELEAKENPNNHREKRAYIEKVSKLVSESRGDKGSAIEVFIQKLDNYSIVYFNILAVDLKIQLAPIFTDPEASREARDFASQVLQEKKLDFVPLYFQALNNFLTACPIYFVPVLLKNWISVSSDLWETQRQKMKQLCQKCSGQIIPALVKKLEDPQYNYDVFSSSKSKTEIKHIRIMMEKVFKDIEKDGVIKDKYFLADPQNL